MILNFKSKIGFLKKLKMHYIIVTKNQLEKTFTLEDISSVYNQRFDVTINDIVKWKGGTMALGNDNAYITFSKARMKQLNVHLNDEVNVALSRDFSKYGFDVPQEFEEVLLQDFVANQRFENLSLGKRRAIIYLIIQVKSSQKRIEKSIFLMENLKKSPVGKETMRHMLGKEPN